MSLDLRELAAADLPAIRTTSGGAAWKGSEERWGRILAEHERGDRLVVLAARGASLCGYGSLRWTSAYEPFARRGIPEIHDLVVAESARRQGVGTRLIANLEHRARAAGYRRVGLGVGLYRDYGPAQRLYARRGYAPDGRGATYGTRQVEAGAVVTVDDGLLLWLVKPLP